MAEKLAINSPIVAVFVDLEMLGKHRQQRQYHAETDEIDEHD